MEGLNNEVLHATVTYYKVESHRNFGFAQLNGGESIYFNHGKRFVPVFNGGDKPDLRGWTEPRYPSQGDRIVVLRSGEGERGLYALQWCYADEYDQAMQQIEQRPTYRLMQQDGPRRTGKLLPHGWMAPRELWRGKDIVRLRRIYPKDQLKAEDKELWRAWFEVLDESVNSWGPADDPR